MLLLLTKSWDPGRFSRRASTHGRKGWSPPEFSCNKQQKTATHLIRRERVCAPQRIWRCRLRFEQMMCSCMKPTADAQSVAVLFIYIYLFNLASHAATDTHTHTYNFRLKKRPRASLLTSFIMRQRCVSAESGRPGWPLPLIRRSSFQFANTFPRRAAQVYGSQQRINSLRA